MVGLNFSDEGEAASFYKAVNAKLTEKIERKQSSKLLAHLQLQYVKSIWPVFEYFYYYLADCYTHTLVEHAYLQIIVKSFLP